ncbi:hypothetical protein [Chryseobacterium indologenes]|uniref:DUF3828 domain-containing protein n=1 Tax=Chryseobacterium indologenes TaxID=253 RepID=A0A0N0ZX36_CHRID|nr:hypothetical protein [Chryseobacterium indologenes]KPE52239.1 hypothetical protein AOB46_04990 [Chryseobacterium indologenes]
MKRTIIASLFLIIACKKEKKEPVTKAEPQKVEIKENTASENGKDESQAAQKWLKENIEAYFKTDLGSMDKAMQKITTQEYYDYKTDAMNVDMDVDGSLTEKEFQDKWKSKFNTEKAGVGSGFLISAQDWIHVEVSDCELESSSKNSYLFRVTLSDDGFKAKYPSQIKVVKEEGKFLIADVLEDHSN